DLPGRDVVTELRALRRLRVVDLNELGCALKGHDERASKPLANAGMHPTITQLSSTRALDDREDRGEIETLRQCRRSNSRLPDNHTGPIAEEDAHRATVILVRSREPVAHRHGPLCAEAGYLWRRVCPPG